MSETKPTTPPADEKKETVEKDDVVIRKNRTSDFVTMKLVLNREQVDSQFVGLFNRMCELAHETAVEHGFWDDKPSDGEKIALMHSELSEALAALRMGNPQDEDLPKYSKLETELADVVIRIMDYSQRHNLRLGDALLAKHNFNQERPHKHGKKF